MMRSELRSYLAFTLASRLQIIRIGVGAENVLVTRYFSTSRSQSSGSNFRWMTQVLPRMKAMAMNPPGPEW
jgi:hypothetical protein